MGITELRKLLKQYIQEAAAAPAPPQSFAEFRTIVGEAIEAAGGPEDLVSEILDLGYEGGGVAAELYSAWSGLSFEMQDAGDEAMDVWRDIGPDYVHDAILDAVSAFKNPMNYGPGYRKPPVNGSALAKAAVKAIFGR